MSNRLVKIVEETLNELTIDKKSEIRKKFLTLIKAKFSDGGMFMTTEAGDTRVKVTPEDIQTFQRYKLLSKKGKGVKLTNKGVACAMGLPVTSNEGDDKYSVEFLKSKCKELFPKVKDTEASFMKWIVATQEEIKGIKVSQK
jgi:hypothetical protein